MPPASPSGQRALALIGLGANIGDPRAQIESALAELDELPDTCLLRHSSLYRTAPMGKLDQPDFVNAAALIRTALGPSRLLSMLLAMELRQHRQRRIRNGPRTLDMDLLTYGDAIIDEPGLCLPHPRMHERRFVLEPVVEIAPDCVIPGKGRAADLLARLGHQGCERLPP